MSRKIPRPIMSIVSDFLAVQNTHAELDSLFFYADAPGEPPDLAKPAKILEWLSRTNKNAHDPLSILGKLLEQYLEDPDVAKPMIKSTPFDQRGIENPGFLFANKINEAFDRYGFRYKTGGIITSGADAPSKDLRTLIQNLDIPAIHEEFERATQNVTESPREAVSAACNILESLFKVYIEENKLSKPNDQSLLPLWKVVRDSLGMDPKVVADQDLKKILSGIISTVDGIGSLRTHASSAHGQGKIRYALKPRHARLATNAAHTLASFVLEAWAERKSN